MTDSTVHLSILFADLSGSVRLYERLPGTEVQATIERYLKRIQLVVEGFSGQMVGIEGDELTAVFPEPASACQAAVEMQKRVSDLPPSSGVKLAVRIGFSYGSASKVNQKYTGEAVSVAACLTGIAGPGQILTNQLAVTALPSLIKSMAKPSGEVCINRSRQTINAFEIQIPRLTYRPSVENTPSAIAKKKGISTKSLHLRYLDTHLVMDRTEKPVRIGRNLDNDILIQTPLASRNHAHIEQMENLTVLVDHSKNGTFVTREGEPEVYIHNGRLPLYGRGTICFGGSIRNQYVDFIEFNFHENVKGAGRK